MSASSDHPPCGQDSAREAARTTGGQCLPRCATGPLAQRIRHWSTGPAAAASSLAGVMQLLRWCGCGWRAAAARVVVPAHSASPWSNSSLRMTHYVVTPESALPPGRIASSHVTVHPAVALVCPQLRARRKLCACSSAPEGPVAQWIRHRPTEPGIAGSSPAGVMQLLRSCLVRRGS